jgi:hypothetical protein
VAASASMIMGSVAALALAANTTSVLLLLR